MHTRKPGYGHKRQTKKENESFLIAAQNNVSGTNYIKVKIDNTQQNSKCRLCGEKNEMVKNISECSKLAQKEYKTKHDCMEKLIN